MFDAPTITIKLRLQKCRKFKVINIFLKSNRTVGFKTNVEE
jgi:hypothetical protein